MAAAACITKGCSSELRSSARQFSDNCTSSGGSTVPYEVWLGQTTQPASKPTEPPNEAGVTTIETKIGLIVGIVTGFFTIVATFFAFRMWRMAAQAREHVQHPESQIPVLRHVDLFAIRVVERARGRDA
ncbi:hypothetical protein DE146DRAFT_629665 [Phaeosphaeria sp. MPI-PUGE-AT-0046c]|nr:hypothetical protein DE146DRAFT_629665 [Phaeosphaeria sp. MPI-PUGE-AT-0046c]